MVDRFKILPPSFSEHLVVTSSGSLLKARVLVSLAILSALVGSTAPSPLYAVYQISLQFTSTTLTALFAIYAIGVLLSLALLGKLSDRLADRRIVIVPALVIVALGSIVFALSSTLDGLFLGRFLAGVGTGALTGSANASLVGFDARDNRSLAPVFATVSFTLGAALGPVLSSVALAFDFYPLVTPFAWNALLAIGTGVGLCLIPWSAPKKVSRLPGVAKRGLSSQMAGSWKPFSRISCLLVVAWSVGSVFVALGPSMVLSTLTTISHSSHARAGLLVTVFQAVAGLTQYFARKEVPERVMRWGGLLLVASWAGCLYALYEQQPITFLICTIISGVGYGACFVGSMGVFTTLAPTEHRATLGSLFYLAGYLGSGACIILMGAAVDAFGIVNASACMLAVITAMLGLLLVPLRRAPSGV
ncbi:MFS transporter [Pseudomonas sp. NPDC089752]|uniref:MFS transporter n=1 Tax=Pseudomonas sp. NPDC089752 TaxID=3364472 RepID=UPI00380813E5